MATGFCIATNVAQVLRPGRADGRRIFAWELTWVCKVA